ncbi:hypothetical protein L9F63_027152, partial [Diploptera punctata]
KRTASFFTVDSRKKQVTLFDPAACGGTAAPEDRRVGVAAPKMFAFDAIFTQEDSQTEVCSTALTDVIHAVINGTDGCLFCFGHARLVDSGQNPEESHGIALKSSTPQTDVKSRSAVIAYISSLLEIRCYRVTSVSLM